MTRTLAPVSQVLLAVRSGARTTVEIAGRTGLSRSVVEAAVDHLGRIGLIDREAGGSMCAGGACQGCGAVSSCASPGRREAT